MSLSILLLSAAVVQAEPEIVVTAAREPVAADEAAVSSTIFDTATLEALTLPTAADILRLSPGLSVSVSGPRGTQTQLRIRGAEASHTLLFLDGIRFNDPAAGNEARFELLTTDLLSRMEIVRGPQSALWGSEALGGVIAASTADPFVARGFVADAEYGSLDTSRLFGRYAVQTGDVGLTASAGWQRSDGIDSFGANGERDGFETFAASLKAVYRSGGIEAGAVGHWIEGTSQFDGFDPLTFLRADTLDETKNRIGAVRGWFSGEWDGWGVRAEAAYLDSANRNRLGTTPLNGTFGDRLTLGLQASRRIGGHLIVAAVDHNEEDFRARDTQYFGGTDQDRSRRNTAFVGQWRAEWVPGVVTDVAVRHDDFNRFDDATTFRAALLVSPAAGWTLHAAYGEGIAQPTFFDLYGFFPGSFVGNPDLRPESSRGWEAGVRWTDGRFNAGLTGFSNRLRNEIVDVFDSVTFLSSTENADGRSHREGVEVEFGYRHAEWLNLSANYTWLDADEQRVAGAALVREVRRPRGTANLIAFGTADRLSWGASIAYVGKRTDTDFDLFPAATVTLDDYALASLRVGYRILPQLELYGRVENAFDANYQDVVGYNTPGTTVYAGLRVALGR
ncbi:MAG: TonB-dependent receptor [Sphingomonas sp.]|nr:TonB-dependent receptor [Sphingomonas sp.]